MNIVDSCGWLEYFADSKYADPYEKIILNSEMLLVPTICIAEVFKKILKEKDEIHALKAIAAMKQGREIELTSEIAISAAKISKTQNIPLVDSIIYATAIKFNARLFTQDNDFRKLDNVVMIEKTNI